MQEFASDPRHQARVTLVPCYLARHNILTLNVMAQGATAANRIHSGMLLPQAVIDAAARAIAPSVTESRASHLFEGINVPPMRGIAVGASKPKV